MGCNPVFIAGAERSGTSLMYALLSSHPNLAMTRRTNFWPYFYNRFGDLRREENLERCLSLMKRYNRLLLLKPDFDLLYREFQQSEASYGRLFALLQEQHAKRLGKPRWGDKSLDTERYSDAIFREYPEAKILHMVRDPRDRYASALSRWKVSRGRVGAGTALWLTSVRAAARSERRYPQGYMVVQYERLAANPTDVLQRICEFIGEDYVSSMLSMEGSSIHRNGGNSSYGRRAIGEISTSSIGRFKQVLPKCEIQFMQSRAKHLMNKFEYQPEQVDFSLPEHFRYYFADLPVNFARMVGWQIIEATMDHVGRKPSARRLVS